jgi:virulence-associated protein VagC
MIAQLIDVEDGEQIVLLPPGFEIDADEVVLTRDGVRVIISPITPVATAPEGQNDPI